MRKNLLIYFLLVSCHCFAQKEAAIWYFGQYAGLDFNTGAPVPLTDGALNTVEGCATISDPDGNLLFYTDGITVWDRNHNPMPNGTGLNGHPSSTQSGIIVPIPQDNDRYYIFTISEGRSRDGLQYNIVDMTLNGGMGDVTDKNQRLLAPTLEKVAAITHANGEDIWILTHLNGSNEFFAYLITAAGLNTTPVITAEGYRYIPLVNGNGTRGYMKASPDGSRVAMIESFRGAEVWRFDNATGMLSDPLYFEDYYAIPGNEAAQFYSGEFSSDSSKLYLGSKIAAGDVFHHRIDQFDVRTHDQTALTNSGIQIHGTDPVPLDAFQLAIDGKIYIARYGVNYLASIENPNAPGLACNYLGNAVSLGSGISQLGLPPFVQSFFGISLMVENFCFGDTTEFTMDTSDPVVSINWDFGDGNTSTLENPTHVYASPGTYIVSVTVTTALGTKTESKEIIIYASPVANPTTNMEVCTLEDTQGFDLETKNADILGGQSATDFEITYHASLADAQNGFNSLVSPYTNISPNQTIYARIFYGENVNCYDITQFELVVKQAPVLNPVTDWVICENNSDGEYLFDLDLKDGEILDGQSASDFSISYHDTRNDAVHGTNDLGNSYLNTTSPQTIFFRIENASYTECYEIGEFDLLVLDFPVAHPPSDIVRCDDAETGQYIFDLTRQDSAILMGQDPSLFEITYHATELEALNDENSLDAQSYQNESLNQVVYARVSHRDSGLCYAITDFSVNINPLPQPDIDQVQVLCPDNPVLSIDGGDFESWDWQDETGLSIHTDRILDIADLGNYTLTVTETRNGQTCEKTVPFEVVSSNPPESFTTTTSGLSDNVTLTIDAIGLGDFEYSLDGENFQSSNEFQVFPGEYTVYVRDVFDCRTLSEVIIALGFQRFFSPNGDGTNDNWNIIGAQLFPNSRLFIYDRYGKLLGQVSPHGQGWDGTYMGRPLPAADYWFRYEYNNGRIHTGHFSLMR